MKYDVLIIEDEPVLAMLVKINLTRRGISSLAADTGLKGLELAAAERPKLVLLDIRLPDIDGWEVCSRLKAASNEWKPVVVFTSAAAQAHEKQKAKEVGGDDFLDKPFEIRELIDIIKRYIK